MAKEYISGEEHRAAQQEKAPGKNSNSTLPWAIAAVAIIVMVGVGAFSLANYLGKTSTNSPSTAQEPQTDGAGGSGSELSMTGGNGSQSGGSGPNLQRPAHGVITSISATSITLKLLSPPEGSSKTFTITSNTKQHTGAQGGLTPFDLSKFKIGDQVAVVPSNADSSQAGIIALQF